MLLIWNAKGTFASEVAFMRVYFTYFMIVHDLLIILRKFETNREWHHVLFPSERETLMEHALGFCFIGLLSYKQI